MKTETAMALAGGRKQLADILGVTSLTTYRWKPDLPRMREFQLKALRPAWFREAKAKAAGGKS